MSLNLNGITIPPNFSGTVRLFPLPNLVLFPGVVQALHIFEPRYRQMTADSLASDQLIAMSLYRSNNELPELGSSESPPVCEHVCICKIVADKKTVDEEYNLLVYGVQRAKIVKEIESDQPYRLAEVELVHEHPDPDCENAQLLRRELIETCESMNLLGNLTKHADAMNILTSDFSLSLLTDLVSFSSSIDCQRKQTILELPDVELRCRALIEFLHQHRDDSENDSFPPDFSAN